MRNELLKWLHDLMNRYGTAYQTYARRIIEKINSIPVPSVEGYLEGKCEELLDKDKFWISPENALSALQSLAADKDEEIGKIQTSFDEHIKMLQCEMELNEKLLAKVEKFRWIPVEERLPTKKDADEDGTVYALVESQIEPYLRRVIKDYRDINTFTKIRNWQTPMPLPEPPKQ